MNRVDEIEINIYWSDLKPEVQDEIAYQLRVVGIVLSTDIVNGKEPLTWKSIDKEGD